MNYAKGDAIYGFGFSRGSFTIRVLVGLIVAEGLVTFRSEEDLERNAAAAYRQYRSTRFPSRSPIVFSMRLLRDCLLWLKDRIKGYYRYEQVIARTKASGRWDIRSASSASGTRSKPMACRSRNSSVASIG